MINDCKILNVTIEPNAYWDDTEKQRNARIGLGRICINFEDNYGGHQCELSLHDAEKLRDELVNSLNVMRSARDKIKIEIKGFEWVESNEIKDNKKSLSHLSIVK